MPLQFQTGPVRDCAKLECNNQITIDCHMASRYAELAASIEANGMVQNIIVRKASKKGYYIVTAGGRRLKALELLAETGKIAKEMPNASNKQQRRAAIMPDRPDMIAVPDIKRRILR